jgi:hypothetical protein
VPIRRYEGMRLFSAVFVVLSVIFVISCAINQKEVDPWLNTVSGGRPPEIDITGRWQDTKGGGFFAWGEGHLRQEENRISGTIGDYDIKGVVSGKMVYLVFMYRGTVYYTAHVRHLFPLPSLRKPRQEIL